MEVRFPGRATSLDQLGPGACFAVAGRNGPDLCLLVETGGRRAALVLNRRHADGTHLPIAADPPADADVLHFPGASLAPSPVLADLAFGRAGEAVAPSLYLGDGSAYLVGLPSDGPAGGRTVTFDVAAGAASAVDTAYLPRAQRWRVLVPEPGGGHVTLYQAEPG